MCSKLVNKYNILTRVRILPEKHELQTLDL